LEERDIRFKHCRLALKTAHEKQEFIEKKAGHDNTTQRQGRINPRVFCCAKPAGSLIPLVQGRIFTANLRLKYELLQRTIFQGTAQQGIEHSGEVDAYEPRIFSFRGQGLF
jgi:hypothetical protein